MPTPLAPKSMGAVLLHNPTSCASTSPEAFILRTAMQAIDVTLPRKAVTPLPGLPAAIFRVTSL